MTRVSMRTNPKMRRKRISRPAPGFLEIPSQALLMALAWQKAPAATVRVMMAPPMISDHLNRDVLTGSRVVS